MATTEHKLSKRRYRALKKQYEEDPRDMTLEELSEYAIYLERGAKQ